MEQFLAQLDVDIDDVSKDKLVLYQVLQEKLKEHPESVELYWRLVQAALALASSREKIGDKTEGKRYTEEAHGHATKAVELGPKSLQAHKW